MRVAQGPGAQAQIGRHLVEGGHGRDHHDGDDPEDDQFQAFLARLDEPNPSAKLIELLHTKAPWEK